MIGVYCKWHLKLLISNTPLRENSKIPLNVTHPLEREKNSSNAAENKKFLSEVISFQRKKESEQILSWPQ